MRYAADRAQWEHTDEEEALHGFDATGYENMPPSLAKELKRAWGHADEGWALANHRKKQWKDAERLLGEAHPPHPNDKLCEACKLLGRAPFRAPKSD